MTGPIAPIRPIRLIRRQTQRPAADERAPEAPTVNLTINVGGEPAEPARASRTPPANLDAHMAAQDARVRGLRGGQKVLDTARATYLKTEWSGPNDRRHRAGKITKTQA